MKNHSRRSRQWTLGRRLAVGFSSLVFLSVLLAVTAFFGVRRISVQLDGITEDALPGVAMSGRMVMAAYEYRVATLRHLMSQDVAEMQALDQQCDALNARFAQLLTEYAPTMTTAEDRQTFEKIDPAFQTYRELAKKVRVLSLELKNEEALRVANTESAPAYTAFEQRVQALATYNETLGKERAERAKTAMTTMDFVVTVVGAVVLVVGILAGVMITRGISRAMRLIADSINDASGQVAAASDQVSASSQSLAEGASEQAASLEETSASLEEMSSMAKRNRESAEQAKELAGQTRASADTGAKQMDEMRRAMDEIKSSSDEIGKIVKTIDEIAFQTNILALNAAVEAARAGDSGAGFAVVAEEVRALAQRSADSARETAAKIEVAIQKSHQGVTLSSTVAAALAEIVDKARKVDAFVAEIAQASREQNEGIQQVNTAVSQMDKVTQSNASNAEETAAAAEELNGQAATLRETVGDLMRLIGGQGAATGQPAAVEAAPVVAAAPTRRVRSSAVAPAAPAPKVVRSHPASAPTAAAPAESSEEMLTFFK